MSITTYVKTLIELCVNKTDIISKLSKEYQTPETDAERIYIQCIEELGH